LILNFSFQFWLSALSGFGRTLMTES
jgi:hypothetical protein